MDTGVFVAVELVNALTLEHAGGRPVPGAEPLPALRRILAVDPQSLEQLGDADVPGFVELAQRLREILTRLPDDVDSAAYQLNELLAEHPAAPHLAKENGRWRLHHHPVALALVPMWTSICAEALARMVGGGDHERFRSCRAPGCERVFLDQSRNASRRFCSTACQNRVKAATFRDRRRPDAT